MIMSKFHIISKLFLVLSIILNSVQCLKSKDPHTIESPMLTDWGTWGHMDRCPEGSFVTGMQLKVEKEDGWKDDTGLNGIRFFCSKLYEKDTAETSISSTIGKWGDWKKPFHCKDAGLFVQGYKYNPVVIGFQLRSEHHRGGFDDTSANNLRIYCATFTESVNSHHGEILFIEGDGTTWGKWTDSQFCKQGYGICGLLTQVDYGKEGKHDDTALNNLKAECCKIKIPEVTETPSSPDLGDHNHNLQMESDDVTISSPDSPYPFPYPFLITTTTTTASPKYIELVPSTDSPFSTYWEYWNPEEEDRSHFDKSPMMPDAPVRFPTSQDTTNSTQNASVDHEVVHANNIPLTQETNMGTQQSYGFDKTISPLKTEKEADILTPLPTFTRINKLTTDEDSSTETVENYEEVEQKAKLPDASIEDPVVEGTSSSPNFVNSKSPVLLYDAAAKLHNKNAATNQNGFLKYNNNSQLIIFLIFCFLQQ